MDVGQRMVEVRTQPDGTIDMCVDPVDELSGQLKEDYIKAREMVYSKFHAALGGNLLALACGGANLNAEIAIASISEWDTLWETAGGA